MGGTNTKFNWLDFLLEGIPVAAEVAPEVIEALKDGELSHDEMMSIGIKAAQALAVRRGVTLSVMPRFSSKIPTEPGFYHVRGESISTVAQRLPDGGFLVIGKEAAVSDHYFDGAQFALV